MIYRHFNGKRLAGRVAGAVALAAAAALAIGPASASAAPARPAPPGTVYAITFAGNSALYTLSPWSHQETLKGYTGASLTDITFRGRALYAVSFTSLYWLNPATGASHLIGSLGLGGANALTTDPWTGALYGADASGHLFWVNPRTGHASVIGTFGRGLISAGDLTFAGGRLYATVLRGSSTETYLATVNLRTGAARVVGDTGYANVYGLATGYRALYGATYGGQFLVISPFSGHAAAVWNDGLAIGGLATP